MEQGDQFFRDAECKTHDDTFMRVFIEAGQQFNAEDEALPDPDYDF